MEEPSEGRVWLRLSLLLGGEGEVMGEVVMAMLVTCLPLTRLWSKQNTSPI
jgi:hypothetical protein